MISKRTIGILVVLALFLAACSTPQEQDSTVVVQQEEINIEVQEDDSGITVRQSTSPPPAPTTTTTTTTMSQEVKDLLEKHNNIKSYSFIKDIGTDHIEFSVRGDKYTKEVQRPSKYTDPAENYDTVFIDRDAETAYAYCADVSSVKCPLENRKDAYELEFEQQDVILPLDLLTGIQDAVVVGQEDIDERHTTIIQFTNSNGQKEKLWLGKFYGFVFQQNIYNEDDEIIESHSFTKAAFNNLKDSDVSLPEGVEVK